MSTLFLSQNTRAIVQGITGKVGQAQTHWMLKAGTPLVAGVTPGRSGQFIEGLPVYGSVAESVSAQGANASVSFVPATYAREAAFEAIQAGLGLVVIVTEHIPIRDTMEIKAASRPQRYGSHRSKLSGHIHPWGRQAGHHAPEHLPPGTHRGGRAQRHPLL